MRTEDILAAMRRLKVETGSLVCMGCGREHGCGIHGCRIVREAADLIEKLTDRCARYAEEIAVLRERQKWVPVTERLPEVWRNDETAELVNYMIYSPDFGVEIGNYHAKAKKWLCMVLHGSALHCHPLDAAAGSAGGGAMERLTFEGNFCDIARCESVPGGSFCESGNCSQREVWERLKAYEDTGLTPESVEALKLSMMGKAISEITEFEGLPVECLKELARADREGRVVVLPCKVGDKLYRVFDGSISEHEVQNIKYFARQGKLGIDMAPFFPDAERFIGKTVFLTREEAEEALRRAEDGNQ